MASNVVVALRTACGLCLNTPGSPVRYRWVGTVVMYIMMSTTPEMIGVSKGHIINEGMRVALTTFHVVEQLL